MASISGRTKVIGIIGDPVAHSRSPAMHNAAFAALGIDAVYVAFHVSPARLREAVRGIRALDVTGLNVTVPHKERILKMLDRCTPRSQLIGAVNTVYRRGGKLVGENTDGTGLLLALRDAGFRARKRRVLIIGAGGAARAAVAALRDAGAARITIVNRSSARRRSLATHFGRKPAPVATADLDALTDPDIVGRVDLVVNATSIGWGNDKFPDIRIDATPKDCLFYDLVYGKDTDFLTRARRSKRPTLDGLSMLLHQGAAAFSLWTGQTAPLDVMSRALRQH